MNEILRALKPVIDSLDELSIPYAIGGSIASSAFGIPRSTLDVDLVISIHRDQAELLKKRLETGFYIDADLIQRALERESSFNIIHLETMLKIDLFVLKGSEYDLMAFSRRISERIGEGDESLSVWLFTPEDVILHKLHWFRAGGEISERQWRDVAGVLEVQTGRLDQEYLREWAKRLNVDDLLGKAEKKQAFDPN